MAEVLGPIHEIDSSITRFQHLLALSPQPDSRRLFSVLGLAMAQFKRHMLSDRREDLDRSIFHFMQSMLLPHHLWLEHGLLFLQAQFFLASALFKRLELSKQSQDAVLAAEFLRHLLAQPLQTFGFPRHQAITMLLNVLAFQVELEASNAVQNIEEMAVLCHELLTSDASDGDTTRSIALISKAISSKISSWGVPSQPLNLTQTIKCLRLARIHKPDLQVAHTALALCLGIRYVTTFVNDDYEEAASILDECITSSSPSSLGVSRDEFLAGLQFLVTGMAVHQSRTHQTPEYSEEVLYRARAFLASPSLEVLSRPSAVFSLEDIAKQRFRYFGYIEGLEASSSNSHLSRSGSLLASRGGDPEIALMLKTMDLLSELRSGIRHNDITTIDEALEKGRTLLASSPSGHPLASYLVEFFGSFLFEAFKRTNKIEYLNESISTYRQASHHVIEHQSMQFRRFPILRQLSLSLVTRSASFPSHHAQDVDEGLRLLSQCVNDGLVAPPERFQLSYWWASLARGFRRPSKSVLTAYEGAMVLMQDTPLFAPTLQLQHATLAKLPHDSHRMPLDYASYWVDLHQLEKAIETLERGRALLWSQMRHFRTSADQLLAADPDLGHKFTAVNRDLEELTKSIPPSHKLSIDDGATDDLRAVDPFGRLLLKQRNLLKGRDNLISQIQALPGFDSFLTSPSFDTLRSAASSGPVIIINHSSWRSHILILLHNTSPSLIPAPHDFYDRASALRDKLLESRLKYGLSSSDYDETLASVLAELYELVGEPVIDRLRELQVPEQSRIWWCPTSVFCSLPLHAMGPIPSDDGEKRYFLDLYICSYTPTLSALIQSRNRGSSSRSSNRPSILLVAQPDPSLPTVGGEIQVVQALDTEVTGLISEAATLTAVIDCFHHHQFVHFACHGRLETGNPFNAGFELHGGERLTLLDIVRSDLPTAEFAFLSACHTAEVTEGSIADEGLHLTAAVQYCGFKSVVGTMWAMVDEDGRDLAEYFYKTLFSASRRAEGIPYHERSAKALRFAVRKLRRKRRITLERWVNFVHYGA
ncbi:CHAT domain-containing protein [Lactarius akahatsu]|uniref:CHAT domain-containing protein n=1 Tax=Lactarius akahatsu TaxID=416441 RepID=A0AAD4LH19_9AGAM|nr:CHAT domain-containing protein [Lactarius akahatsu]